MKKVFSFLMVLAVVFSLAVPQAQAAEDLNAKFEDAVWLLDGFGFEYNAVYMHYFVSRQLYTDEIAERYDYESVAISAAEYEAVLYKYFEATDAQLAQIREYEAEYNVADQTYMISYPGGFGGAPAEYEYQGYVTSGDGYDIYSVGMKHTYLDSKFASYSEYETYVDALDWPDSITYEGVEYKSDYGEYINTVVLGTGRKYHVKLSGDVVKFVSCVTYTEDQLPEKFEPIAPQITVNLPTDGSVTLPNTEEAFADGTEVTVSVINNGAVVETAKTALSEIATEFVVYDFSAVKNNKTAQPNGDVMVVFAVPNGFSKDISVYYMDDMGKLEVLASKVSEDGKSVSVTLTHFSTYILTDNSTKPEQNPQPSDPTVSPETSAPAEPSQPATAPGDQSEPSQNIDITESNVDEYSDDQKIDGLVWFIIIAAVLLVASLTALIVFLTKKK